MSFSEKLKMLRKDRNLSQEEFAELLNVSRQAVSKWELGEGYPEMEKMIFIAKELHISLDELFSEETGYLPNQTSKEVVQNTGRVMIKSFDGKTLVNCIKVNSSKAFGAKKDEPKYALFGVDSTSWLGDNSTILGWYADEESIQNEINGISEALLSGAVSYKLKYASKVNAKTFSVKFIDKI